MNRTVDALIVFRFIKLLVTPFNKQAAYREGIIDMHGNRMIDPETGKPTKLETTKQKSSYTILHKLIFNIKRLLLKLPFINLGNSGTWLSAMYLLKDTFKESKIHDLDLIEHAFSDVLGRYDITIPKNIIKENINLDLDEGTYIIKSNVLYRNGNDFSLAEAGDEVVAEKITKPIGQVSGYDIYELTHKKTNQKIYISSADLSEDAPTTNTSGVSMPADVGYQKNLKKKSLKDILRRNDLLSDR